VTFSFQAAVAGRGFDVALTVGREETLAVMGPNGAGKSTLLASIAGLLKPDSGRAELDGRTLFHLDPGQHAWVPPHHRGTALLAQEPLLFPHLSALDNVGFGPRSAGRSRRDARAVASRWLTEVEAAQYADRRPGRLSGGQAQRVAVARALAHRPSVVLLDEPFGALDAITRADLQSTFLRVRRELGFTAVLVTHDIAEAFLLAERVAVLRAGQLEQVDPPERLRTAPATPYVAELLQRARVA
jgi:molybdate transport system ATP-binding protein